MNKKIFMLFVTATFALNVFAANRYWIGTGDNNWNNTANWSTTSGGIGGASLPGINDTAVFDGNGIVNCLINTSVNVNKFNVLSGYTGTITQGSGNSMTIGSGGAIFSGGVFAGGNSTINITTNGGFTLSGTNFISTSGNLQCKNWNFSSGTFNHNNGRVILLGILNNSSGSTVFSRLTLSGGTIGASFSLAGGTIFTVDSTFEITGTGDVDMSGGSGASIDAKGNITITNTGTGGSGNLPVNIIGTGNQTVSNTGISGQGKLINVNVNKPSGTLFLVGTISIFSTWAHAAGTVDPGTSTAVFFGRTSVQLNLSGNILFHNLIFTNSSGINQVWGIPNITVAGTLTISGSSGAAFAGGTINARGNITVTNSSTAGGGTTNFLINGTADQTLTGKGVLSQGNLPSVTINKPSGTLFLSSLITVANNFTYVSGTVDASANNSTVALLVTGNTHAYAGSMAFHNLRFHVSSTAGRTVAFSTGTTWTVNGTLTISGNNTVNFSGSNTNMDAFGDIIISRIGTGGSGGTGFTTLNIKGSANQVFTGNGVAGTGGLPNITINKTGGTLELSSIISVGGSWTYTAGTVAAGFSTVVFYNSNNIDGEGSSSTMAFNNVYLFANTRTLTGNLIANGDIKIYSGAVLNQNSKTINLGGNWDNSGTYTTSPAMVTFNGSADQSLIKSSGSETFTRVNINKSSGNLTLSSPVVINDSLKLTKGVVISTSTNYVRLIDNAKASGGADTAFVSGFMRKLGNDAFVFPIGDNALASGKYHPLEITAPVSLTDEFSAEYFSSGQTFGNTTDSSLSNLSNCEYWNVNQIAGTSSVSVTMNWNSNSCNIASQLNDMRTARWNGTKWADLGNGGTTGNNTKGSVTTASATSAFGAFALVQMANQPGSSCTNAINLGQGDTCANNITMTDSVMWFRFLPDSIDVSIDAYITGDTSETDSTNIILEVYDQSCGNLRLIQSDASGFILLDSLTQGNPYTIKLRLSSPTNFSFDVCLFNEKHPLLPGVQSGCTAFGCGFNLVSNGDFESAPFGNPNTYSLPAPAGTNMTYVTSFTGNGKEYFIRNSNGLGGCLLNEPSYGGGSYAFSGDPPSHKCSGCNAPWEATPWSQPVSVTAGRTYIFSAWFFTPPFNNQAKFQFQINGTPYGPWFTVSPTCNQVWENRCLVWTSYVTGIVPITIECRGKWSVGYPFALDKITFRDVSYLPPPITVSTPNTTICQGQSVILTASGGSSYTWSTTQFTPSITVTPNVTTTYYINVINPETGCTGQQSITITVIQPPSISFSFSPSPTCMGNAMNFSVNVPEPNTSYNWNFGDPASSSNNTATGTTATHTYNTPGNFTVALTASNQCFTNTTTPIVTIIPSTATYNSGCCSEDPSTIYTDTYVQIVTPIGSPTIWNNVNKVIRNEINILPNCELVINSSTIEFGPIGRIFVQRGGKLTINNSNLIGLTVCETMWQGIQVWGDATKNQTQINLATNNIYQGKIIINSSSIRDAHNAVTIGRPKNSFFETSKGGGIVIASSSGFLGNGISIRFGPYNNFSNISLIDNCRFSPPAAGTIPLLDPGYGLSNPAGYTYPNANNPFYGNANTMSRTFAQVHLFGVRNVLFRDNEFYNAEYGVISGNSSSRYLDGDNSGTSNTFKDLTYGMRHEYFWSTFFGNRIELNRFDKAFGVAPIYINAGKNDRIIKNEIDDPNTPNSGYFAGIGLANSTSPYIVDNNVNNCFFGIASSNTGNFGLIGYETQGNIFNNCGWATWVPGNNPGLQIRCNKYNPIGVSYMKNWYVGGTLPNQYTNWPILIDKDPSGNDFNPNNVGTLNEIQSQVNVFNYYHHNPTVSFPAVQPAPSGILTASNIINTSISKLPNSCDPIPCAPPCTLRVSLENKIAQLQVEFNSTLANLDKGLTAQLLSAISGNTSSGNLKNMLVQNSPLSDEVLTAYINRSGNPPGHVEEVIIPNSPVSNPVRSLLYVKLATMPNGISMQIKNAQISNVYRTLTAISRELESSVIKRQGMVVDEINFYVDNDMQQDAINLLEAENTVEADQTLIGTYLANDDYSSASAKLNSMSASNPEEQSFIDLQNALLNIYSQGRSIYEMDSIEVQLVRNIAGSSVSSIARSNACAILFFAYNEDCGFDFNTNNLRTDNVGNNFSSIQEKTDGEFLDEAYPNPATNKIYIPYYLPEENGGIMNIYDVNGKTLGSFILMQGDNILEINTAELPSGVYAYGITIDGIQAETKRMVIIKNE